MFNNLFKSDDNSILIAMYNVHFNRFNINDKLTLKRVTLDLQRS